MSWFTCIYVLLFVFVHLYSVIYANVGCSLTNVEFLFSDVVCLDSDDGNDDDEGCKPLPPASSSNQGNNSQPQSASSSKQCEPIRIPGPSTLDANKLKRPTQPLVTAEVMNDCGNTAADRLLSLAQCNVISAQLLSLVTEAACQKLEGKYTDVLP